MTLHVFTIVLDGMPWIAYHLPVLNKLSVDWHWHIIEGVAKPVACTAWCKRLKPRLSNDGTSEYLDSISGHPNISLYRKEEWEGKIEQVNAPCHHYNDGDIVMEIDSDEIWTTRQLESVVQILSTSVDRNRAAFFCRYFFGPNIVITSKEGYGNHGLYEWRRAWKVKKGFAFTKHEPPISNQDGSLITREETEQLGLVFDHYAYATEKQVAFKEKYYGYRRAVQSWNMLQNNSVWPAELHNFMPWVKPGVIVDKI